MKNVENKKLSLAQKAVVVSVVLAPVLTMAAEGDGAVTVDASAISALQGPVAVVGGAILAILIAIKGWKLVRRAL
ncbi:major capsid protein [Acinetobacter sp. YH12098]|uniref:major capsid protein n=1 Tax=Acinetobacter sp. YH12098 TaxID=2601087 RepID=UPI0015D139EA|nr:major capsid protein [Acinetobacter sp. YH12098]